MYAATATKMVARDMFTLFTYNLIQKVIQIWTPNQSSTAIWQLTTNNPNIIRKYKTYRNKLTHLKEISKQNYYKQAFQKTKVTWAGSRLAGSK